MSEEISQYRVIQNGNPFEDARLRLAPHEFKTVVDVGANVGDLCEHLLANFPRAHVHAFEPSPKCFVKLAQRYAGDSRVTCRRLGLSNAPARSELYEFAESGLNALSALAEDSKQYLDGYGVALTGKSDVDLIALDDYCNAEKIPQIDFLKMDVQGWELQVLQGATELLAAGRIKAVYTEVCFVQLYREQSFYEDLAEFLRRYNFRLFSLYAQSFNRHNQLCWADALFLPASL